ncbi:hypothetical protein DXG03_000290 [Asterophora parasitica]|uniref:ER membrane protein complex subunit 10 n=1 Tax=Asterophora parasitica TaxID=117018 RepID=A0A9P7KEA8_9AGAR|nr:hypothetical protein DXG03_000290 [Asterophora parasitica]
MMRVLALAAILVAPTVYADATVTVFHRLFHPTAPQAHFSQRGTIHIADNSTFFFQPAPSFTEDISSFAGALHTVQDSSPLLYQIALERAGTPQAQWDISSVKACHLHQATSESIHLHVLDAHSPKPYALDYFVAPIPHDAACPRRGSQKATTHASLKSFASVSSTVILKGPRFPPPPQLTTPPSISPEGETIVPVPEKSFLQKYWMYIVGLVIITVLSGGPEEERPKK